MNSVSLIELLHARTTKQELAGIYGITERDVRKRLKQLAEKVPVIAVSTEVGYRLATGGEDLEQAEQTYFELLSRIRELSLRAKPLKHYITMVKAGATDSEIQNHFNLGE